MVKKAKSKIIADSNRKLVIGTLIGASFFFSMAAFGLAIYNYKASTNPLFISFDGNSTSFGQSTISDIAARVSPGVVSILTDTRTANWTGQPSTTSVAGTGIVITKDGYVLTNKHVVEGAKSVRVVLDDGTSYDRVTILGVDPLNDVAFLKVENVNNLSTIPLGDSSTLHIGQDVVAIGNALGQYQNTVTEGIISGNNRMVTALDDSKNYYEQLSDMIQTDASINPGNSGGPLVNAGGQVIGINTAVSSEGNNIGFAIPINSVKGMLDNLFKTGKVERAYIGVRYITLTPDTAKQLKLSTSAGAYLADSEAIISGSPAEKAGILAGDIITKVNNITIGESGSLATLIAEHPVGDTVDLTYLRDGNEHTAKITLVAYPTSN